MNTWSIGRRVGTAFAGVLLVVVLLGAFSVAEFSGIGALTREIAGCNVPQTVTILQVQQLVKENFGLAQAYRYAPDREAVAQQVADNVARIDGLIRQYEALLTSDSDRRAYAEFKVARSEWVASFKALMGLVKAGKQEEAGAWIGQEVLVRYAAVDRRLRELSDRHLAALDTANRGILGKVDLGQVVAWIGAGSAVLISIAVGTLVSIGTARTLRRTADQLIVGSQEVVNAAGQVAAASASLASGANEQAAALQETSASMEEMEGVTRGNCDHTNQARTIAAEARAVADAGGQSAERLAGAMKDLRASSSEVAKIVKAIDEIAFQTNILALNAAVEAARAGEAGAGFAVVAEEVRALAQRSAQAARETSDKIAAAVARSDEGVRISEEVGANLRTISGRVKELDSLVDSLAQSAGEQSQGIGQINQAVAQVDKVTQSNAAAAEEASAAAEELNEQARVMNQLIGEMMVVAGGRRETDSAGLPGPGQPDGKRRLDPSSTGLARPSPIRSMTVKSRISIPA